MSTSFSELCNLLDLLVEGPGANVVSQEAKLPIVQIVVVGQLCYLPVCYLPGALPWLVKVWPSLQNGLYEALPWIESFVR